MFKSTSTYANEGGIHNIYDAVECITVLKNEH